VADYGSQAMKSPSVNKFNINMKGIDIGHADADSSANYGMEEELTMPWQTTRDEEPVALQ